ncbi:hypothetical protein AQUCO_00300465v1 [Aquilegia coerulea]|uniref:Uncharacterized protein n=1 Tax=Aquilegia coerulea TaxID=218851 RepID=A0A2G5EZ11_AQUCA|nr:hypothetical protein AQUCO_00300465v1 [Aquilegia coerulea]
MHVIILRITTTLFKAMLLKKKKSNIWGGFMPMTRPSYCLCETVLTGQYSIYVKEGINRPNSLNNFHKLLVFKYWFRLNTKMCQAMTQPLSSFTLLSIYEEN